MKFFSLSAIATVAVIAGSSVVQAATFNFFETVDGVRMSSSGQIDVSGLVANSNDAQWGGVGVEDNFTSQDIMGANEGNGIDQFYNFNDGTDTSAWLGDNGPFSSSFFGFDVTSGDTDFTTHARNGGGQLIAGLGIDLDDLVGNIWTPDSEWLAAGATFATTGLIEGIFSITDAVSGETLSIVVGDRVTTPPVPSVPLPATLPLLLSVLGGMGALRLRRKSA